MESMIVIPRLADERIIFVRHSARVRSRPDWALPTALLANPLDLMASASLCLHLATDYVPGRLLSLGEIIGADGDAVRCLLATELRPSLRTEPITAPLMVSPLSPTEVDRQVARGWVRQVETLLALQMLVAHLEGAR
jgi:hypothetical protein